MRDGDVAACSSRRETPTASRGRSAGCCPIPPRADEMGARARSRVKARFTRERMLAGLAAVLSLTPRLTSVYRSPAMDTRVPPETPASRPLRRSGGEDSVEARRYLDALRRRIWLIVLLGLTAAATAVAISSWMPDRYKATASIVKQVTTGPYESVNVDALTRELSTIEQLLLTSDVLDRAAKHVEGETRVIGQGGARVERRSRGEPHLRHRHGRQPEAGRPDRERGGRHLHREAARRHAQAVRAGSRRTRAGAQQGPRPARRHASRRRRSSNGSRSSASPWPGRAWTSRWPSAPRRRASGARRDRCATASSRSSSASSSASSSPWRATSSCHA